MVNVGVETPLPSQPNILATIKAIAEERRGYLSQLKIALEKDDIDKIKIYARKLVGTSPINLT